MTYYEYNEFMADTILNLFAFDEAVEFVQVPRSPCLLVCCRPFALCK